MTQNERVVLDLTLGERLGGGGQGEVFALARHPGLAAKVYNAELDIDKRAYLEHLISMRSPSLQRRTAWPVALQDDNLGKPVLVLPLVPKAREVHDFYGPASRAEHFPLADWGDNVRVAAALADIVANVHGAGFVVGDLNEQNFLITPHLQPVLIDCDSVMSTHGGRSTEGGLFREDWLAPELIGADLTKIARSPNHDNFALAGLLFRLLMQGRDPFVGVWRGPAPSAADAVAGHVFVYDRRSAVAPPPMAPSFGILPEAIRRLFEGAFARSGRTRRPSAAEWSEALRTLAKRLARCEAGHVYSVHLRQACPWCSLDRAWVRRAQLWDRQPDRHGDRGLSPATAIQVASALLAVTSFLLAELAFSWAS